MSYARQQNILATPSSYDVLGVPFDATDTDIKLAYRRLVQEWHPDKQMHHSSFAEQNLKVINEAYSSIKSRSARETYNRVLRLQMKAAELPASSLPMRNTIWAKFWIWLTTLESTAK
jgi:curved DNA-binding protein CbpA